MLNKLVNKHQPVLLEEIKTFIPGKASPVSELYTYPEILPVLAENKIENKRKIIEFGSNQ